MANEVKIRVTADDDSRRGLNSAQGNVDKFTRTAQVGDRAASALGSTLRTVGAVAGGFLAAGVIQAGFSRLQSGFSESITAATDLGESINAVNVVFGDSATKIQEWGRTNSTAFGLSRREFNQMATPLGAMLKNTGMEMDDVADTTIALTERASDMASVFNRDVGEALEAIQAGLRGESDPLEQFGVGLSAAAVQAKALADTGKETADELTNVELATARVGLIMQQTSDVQGDFANTSDSAANRQRILAAEIENTKAKIGDDLMPIQQAWLDLKLRTVQSISDWTDSEKGLNHTLDELQEVLNSTVIPAIHGYGSAIEGDAGPATESFADRVEKDLIPALKDADGEFRVFGRVIGEVAEDSMIRARGTTRQLAGSFTVLSGVVKAVSRGIVGDWEGMWAGLKEAGRGAGTVLHAQMERTFGGALAFVERQVARARKVAAGWGRAIVDGILGALYGLPSHVQSIINRAFDVKVPNLGLGSAFAAGGIVGAASGGPRSGFALVGEQGPELVRLPTGGTVIPAGQSRQMMSGGGRQDVRVWFDFTGLDSAFGALIQKAVRVDGAGSAQGAFGMKPF